MIEYLEYTEEQLKLLTNEQIKNHFLNVRSQLIMKQQKFDSKNIEIYLCYITKEIQNRDIK